MNKQPLSPVAESYPTFWSEQSHHIHAVQTPPDEAYSAFVNLIEEELPESEYAQADMLPDA